MASVFSFATRTLFNAIINGNRGTQAPYTQPGVTVSPEARAQLDEGGPLPLKTAPGAMLQIHTVPQASDFTHVANQMRMLPAFSLESTSGGWVAVPYSIDPPPSIPDVILPAAIWQAYVGEIHLIGLQDFAGQPMPGIAYPGIFGGGSVNQ